MKNYFIKKGDAMIPKKIHYCWFGGKEKPEKAKKCIASWKRYCPDYEIIEWNEENFDVNRNGYTKMCIEEKKYAFLSDYARLLIVEEFGGIYFDTDVEVVRNFDDLLEKEAFFGFENEEYVATGLGFGAEKHHKSVRLMLDEYEELLDGTKGVKTCPALNTNALVKMGLVRNGEYQKIEGVEVYPVEYFNPYEDPTGRLKRTRNTYSIHWYSKSWLDKKSILRSKITQPFHRIFGVNCFEWMKRKK